MAASAVRPFYLLRHLQRHRFSSTSTTTNETPLQRSIRSAIESRDYLQIPNLLHSNPNPNPNPNPFSYLSLLPPTLTARIVGELLHSFLPLRPRSLLLPAYSSLLSLSLPKPGHNFPSSVFLPIALAVLQATLRSGAPPPRETRLALPLSWLHLRRHRRRSAAGILSSLHPLGFRLDLNTLTYLLSSLCAAGEPAEAVAVLRGMPVAGIDPESESYCTVIEAADDAAAAEALLSEMVAEKGMTPRKGTVARVARAMRAEGEVRRAAEMVKFLEGKGCAVGFEAYEAVAEGCVESGEMVLAARVVAEMARRGFVPYVGVRQRVVEGLAAIGQGELAGAVRQRLAEIGS
ncbi:pentatricopeptide repeat-containing protein At1g06270 [Elaeis guineensis]|uniref:Pentatricopeptide repeat-containing protein At1g06270 n=1 Tax=Elaeis guineensis var. tenera TaxID=51953 RepID=A0A6I9R1J8_ELAGV|nr:pentatricopeptide repeat-containing protein At1g06270 [Elaeis guineensis]